MKRQTPQAPTRPRGRLERGTLTPEVIVEAALRILGENGELTFALLGRQLGASPTAVYRHFAGRDDILDAVGDELIRISLDGYEPSRAWEDSLRDLADRAWVTYGRHPAAAKETFFRVTRGLHELKAVDAILQALDAAGLSESDAVTYYHMFAMSVLSLSGDFASKLVREMHSPAGWEQVYRPGSPDDYPYYWRVRDRLRDARDDHEVFALQIEAIIDAVRAVASRSPQPPAVRRT